MTNVIEGLGARIGSLPAELLEDAIKEFIVVAERNGGTMMGGKYQLTAKPTSRRYRGEEASALMQGTPSGFWVWRETGTGAHLIKPKRKRRGRKVPGPMGGDLGHPVWGPVMHPGMAGSMRWTKTVNEADAAIEALIRRALEKAVA